MAEKAAALPDNKATFWKKQIKLCDREYDKWTKRCEKIVKRYRDEREQPEGAKKKFNVMWSNVQTLRPSIYGRMPQPIAERRFLDADPVGRTASQILERCMRYEMEDSDFDCSVKAAVLDYLLTARGQVWARYEPIIGPATSLQETGDTPEIEDEPYGDRAEGDEGEAEYDGEETETAEPPAERVLDEYVCIDYVNWKDFYIFPAKVRTWKEAEAVGKRVYMSRDELVQRFGKKVGEAVQLTHQPEGLKGEPAVQSEDLSKAEVFEIWDKPGRKVCFISTGYHDVLEERDDPLKLTNFWPCPKPLFATTTNDSLIPVPDYVEYQDQAIELDELTNRIDMLMKALKVAGVYDAANKELSRLLNETTENQLIPVNSWAAFAEKGGLKSTVDFLPIENIAKVLMSLFEARDKIKEDLYEITGIADIIRGQSDPDETAKAQSIKGRFATVRLKDRQDDVANFCRDIICIMGEIIAEHFSSETLVTISSAMNDEGIGKPMPEEPAKPDEKTQQPPNPMMGHNGGPPMGGSPGLPPIAAPGGPGPAQGPMLGGAQPAPPPASPGGPNVIHGPFGGARPPMAPISGLLPPPMQQIPPEILQYQAEMAQYQQKKLEWASDKMALINRAIDLLRQDKLRGFRIDIETDTTLADSAEDEKGTRVEFVTAASGFLKQAMEAGAMYPKIVPLLGKMMLFAIRGFRAGRDLESSFEDFIEAADKDAKAKEKDGNQQPTPEQIKQQTELAKSQAEIQKTKMEADSERENGIISLKNQQQDHDLQMLKIQGEMAKMRQEMELGAKEHQFKMAELAAQHQATMQSLMLKQQGEAEDRAHEKRMAKHGS